jgi:hypothetical protein
MFSLFKKKHQPKTRLVKLANSGSILPQYSIQEYNRIGGWSNAEPVFFATNDELAVEVYNEWKKKDQVTTLIEN